MKARWSKTPTDLYDLKLSQARAKYMWLWLTFATVFIARWIPIWDFLLIQAVILILSIGYTIYAIHLRESAPLAKATVLPRRPVDR